MNTIHDDLLLHLKLNDIQANRAPDSSQPPKDGTLHGGVRPISDDRFGLCLQFDGADGRVSVDAETFRTIANTFTVAAWVAPEAIHQIDPQSTSGIGGTGGQKFMIYPSQGDATYGSGQGHAGAGISVGTNGISVYEHADNYMPPLLVWQRPENDSALKANSWTHIAVVYQNKTPSLYVNGQLVKTGLTSSKSLVHPSGEIGGGHWGYFPGKIGNVRFYKRALSEAEIQQVMDSDQLRQNTLRMNSNQRLDRGKTIEVAGKGFLIMQTDGNLVAYNSANQPKWATGTSGKAVTHAIMQTDSNLVIYNGGTAIWSSQTWNLGANNGYFEIDLNTWRVCIFKPDGIVVKELQPATFTASALTPEALGTVVTRPTTIQMGTTVISIPSSQGVSSNQPLKFPRQQNWESKMCTALGIASVAPNYAGLTPFQKAIGTMGLDAAEVYFPANEQPNITPQQVIDKLQAGINPLSNFSRMESSFTGTVDMSLADMDLRDALIGLIIAQIVEKLKLNQNDAESIALRDWAIPVFRQMRVDVAIGTLKEYEIWKANPCAYSAPGYQKPQSCHAAIGHIPYNSMWQTEKPPSDLLLKAGLAYAAGKNDKIVKGVSAGLASIGLVGGFLAAGTGIGVAIPASLSVKGFPILTSLFAAFGGNFGASKATLAAAAAIGPTSWAGVVAGPAAVIVAAAMIGISHGVAVIEAAQVEFKLRHAIATAMNEHINIANVIADANLISLLFIGIVKSANDGWKAPSLTINGEVTFFCEAGYVAKFYLDYTLNGQRKSFNTGDLTVGFWRKYEIPAAATNIEVRGAMIAAGEHQIFKETLQRPTYISYKVYGTIFKQAWNNDWPRIVSGEISSKAGDLKFTHGAGFVARWQVTYDLLDKANQSIQSGDTSLGWKRTYNIPLDATNVRILVRGATGLAWEPWRTTYDKTFPSAPNLCLKIYGTTLNQQWNNDCA